MKFKHLFLPVTVAVFFSACQRDEITVVRVPKTTKAASVPLETTSAEETPMEIKWTTPKTWRAQPPSSMRVGSFLAKGTNGMEADISVVPLSGPAGGDVANIDRWREQLNLSPLAEGDLKSNSRIISPAGRKMTYINIVSNDLLIDGKFKKRLVAAIYESPEKTWFFKMTGEDETVTSVEPSFLEFLKSLQFTGK